MTFLKMEEVAKILNTSICTVRRLCETGKLPAVDIGTGKHRIWRIRPEDLDAFLPTKAPPAQSPRGLPMGVMKIG